MTIHRTRHATVFVAMVVAGTAGCPETDPVINEDLIEGPQIFSSGNDGIVVFRLTPSGSTDTQDVVLVNGGRARMEIRKVRIEDPSAANFAIVSAVPTVPSVIHPREALGVRVSFTSPGRGLHLAQLIVESNADNFPTLSIDLVGPGAANPIPPEPDIERIKHPIEISPDTEDGPGSAKVRYINLGGGMLVVSGYTLEDTDNFTILPDVPIPGIACTPEDACMPTDGAPVGCCDLACRGTCDGGVWDTQACDAPCPPTTIGEPDVACLDMTCDLVHVASGSYVVVPVTFTPAAPATGPYDVQFRIQSNDPDQPNHNVRIMGDR